MPAMLMQHDIDPKDFIYNKIGDFSDFELTGNQVLVAVYLRPEQTKSGLYLTDQHRDEDKHQSKVGLVLAQGPNTFVDDKNWAFHSFSADNGDWIVFRPSDGWQITVNEVLCRILTDTSIKGRIQQPDQVW